MSCGKARVNSPLARSLMTPSRPFTAWPPFLTLGEPGHLSHMLGDREPAEGGFSVILSTHCVHTVTPDDLLHTPTLLPQPKWGQGRLFVISR